MAPTFADIRSQFARLQAQLEQLEAKEKADKAKQSSKSHTVASAPETAKTTQERAGSDTAWKVHVPRKSKVAKAKCDDNAVEKKPAGIRDSLLPEGWSVPVVESCAGMNVSSAGVCLATMEDARALRKEMSHASVTLVVVTSGELTAESVAVEVQVRDKDGLLQVRRRFLTQIGAGLVKAEFQPQVKGVGPKNRTNVVALCLWERWCTKEQRKKASASPLVVFKHWLRDTVQVGVVDVFLASNVEARDGSLSIRVFVRASTDVVEMLANRSGAEGCFAKVLVAEGQDLCIIVWLWGEELSLAAASRQAERIKCSVGVVSTGSGACCGFRCRGVRFARCRCAARFVGRSVRVCGGTCLLGPKFYKGSVGRVWLGGHANSPNKAWFRFVLCRAFCQRHRARHNMFAEQR